MTQRQATPIHVGGWSLPLQITCVLEMPGTPFKGILQPMHSCGGTSQTLPGLGDGHLASSLISTSDQSPSPAYSCLLAPVQAEVT